MATSETSNLRLHGFWRGSSPYRTRIGLELKQLAYEQAPVNIAAMEHQQARFLALNPQGLTPALQTDAGVMIQSLAILEWLEEVHPQPPLLPEAPQDRQIVRAMAQLVACDIHPLNNARVLRRLKSAGFDDAARDAWIEQWIIQGFDGLEPMIARHGRGWSFGASPGLADCCLVPQVYSARRFNIDLTAYPAIRAVADAADAHPAFQRAHPSRQPDAA